MAAGKEKRPTHYDEYSVNSSDKTKRLEDLFKYEAKLMMDSQKLRKKLGEEDYQAKLKFIAKADKEAAKTIKKQAEDRLKSYLKELAEYKQFLAQQTNLSKKQQNKQVKAYSKAQQIEEKTYKKRKAREGKEELVRAKQQRKSDRNQILESSKYVLGGVGTFGEQMTASLSKVGENIGKAVGKAFNDISNKINSMMDTYSKYQSAIDTRLQDSGKTFIAMQSTLKNAVGASPYLKTETLLTNLQTLVEAGIVQNVEQRAFLNTIKDKVATTFDAANSSLLRIIRLQQNDSTAVRLGMEAYLTSFLNQTVKNTEYLNSVFDSVSEALLEASSTMTTQASTEFEYVVQKWLGVMVGRGLSDNTANQLATALGYLGSGNVSSLSGSALNNLLVMAAANAGLDYADLLTNGLSAQDTNTLMKSIVSYMQEINNSGNKVVRSQYAQTFGLNLSDLMAATGMTQEEINSVAKDMLTIDGMFSELGDQLNQVASRTHISEKIANLFDNAQFSLASNIAGNSVMAAMWKVTDMIQGVTGGINIPAISAMGNMVDLEATVENLMKLGLVGVGSFSMIGDIVTGLSNSGGNFSNTLNRLNISNDQSTDIISRLGKGYTSSGTGTGLRRRSRGLTTSQTSSLISNSSGDDISSQTLNSAMDDAKKDQVAAMEDQDNPMSDVRDYLIKTFDVKFSNLLSMVAHSGGYSAAAVDSGVDSTNLFLGSKSAVATYVVDSKEESNRDVLDNISKDVGNIYTLLSEGRLIVTTQSAGTSGTLPSKNSSSI